METNIVDVKGFSFEKLVRDKIPSVAPDCKFRYADPKEFEGLLIEKFDEETRELINEIVYGGSVDDILSELGDLMSVVIRICMERGSPFTRAELEQKLWAAHQNKDHLRGAFNRMLVIDLETVNE